MVYNQISYLKVEQHAITPSYKAVTQERVTHTHIYIYIYIFFFYSVILLLFSNTKNYFLFYEYNENNLKVFNHNLNPLDLSTFYSVMVHKY